MCELLCFEGSEGGRTHGAMCRQCRRRCCNVRSTSSQMQALVLSKLSLPLASFIPSKQLCANQQLHATWRRGGLALEHLRWGRRKTRNRVDRGRARRTVGENDSANNGREMRRFCGAKVPSRGGKVEGNQPCPANGVWNSRSTFGNRVRVITFRQQAANGTSTIMVARLERQAIPYCRIAVWYCPLP
jgi:hypothetical protein